MKYLKHLPKYYVIAFFIIVFTAIMYVLLHERRVPIKDDSLFDSSYEYDKYLLNRLGQGECSVCDPKEIKMVMSVALNRVANKRFPNNLHDVLYQDNQFHGMYRADLDKNGNEIISDKVNLCSEEILANGSTLPSNILGFIYPSKIISVKGTKWYGKIKDSVVYKMKYHHFYKL